MDNLPTIRSNGFHIYPQKHDDGGWRIEIDFSDVGIGSCVNRYISISTTGLKKIIDYAEKMRDKETDNG